jgi:hypothetical protein
LVLDYAMKDSDNQIDLSYAFNFCITDHIDNRQNCGSNNIPDSYLIPIKFPFTFLDQSFNFNC